jgi:hypothetical protein
MVFSSPRLWPKDDCILIESVLINQLKEKKIFPFSDDDVKKMKTQKLRVGSKKEITVTIPDIEDENLILKTTEVSREQRDSIVIQSKVAEIGSKLGFKIWIPRADRSRVLEVWHPNGDSLLDELPLVFDEFTLKTIRNIDVLWIKRHTIIRAFEIEHTTSIYSGILRMADLLSLQPMLDIKIHIVAPVMRRDSVFQQISRPVFTVMEKGPLSESCSYISYDSIIELFNEKRLEYMTDTILDEYLEYYEG